MPLDPTHIIPVQTLTAHFYIRYTRILPFHVYSALPSDILQLSQLKILRTPFSFPVGATRPKDCVLLYGIMLITHGEDYALLHSVHVVSSLLSPNIMFSSPPYSQHPHSGFFPLL